MTTTTPRTLLQWFDVNDAEPLRAPGGTLFAPTALEIEVNLRTGRLERAVAFANSHESLIFRDTGPQPFSTPLDQAPQWIRDAVERVKGMVAAGGEVAP